jgi:hypothetical protein
MRSIALAGKWVTCLVQGCVIETRVTRIQEKRVTSIQEIKVTSIQETRITKTQKKKVIR